jgi:hypothetical protein
LFPDSNNSLYALGIAYAVRPANATADPEAGRRAIGVGVPEPTDTPSSASPQHHQGFDRVGLNLRRAFEETAAEPLPRAFEDLLRELR